MKGRSAAIAGLISSEDMAKRYQSMDFNQLSFVMTGLVPRQNKSPGREAGA